MELYYQNEYFVLFKEANSIYISVLKAGFDIGKFNKDVLSAFPRLKITKFAALSAALTNGLKTPILIGECMGIVECSVSADALLAYAKLYLTEVEFNALSDEQILKEIDIELNRLGISYGHLPLTKKVMGVQDKFVVAKGNPPKPGKDAVVSMYELQEIKPSVESEGGVDHYELNVINKILEGEWLGDRKEPTKGIPGISIYGKEIPAPDGKQITLKYDVKTVGLDHNEDEHISTLRAKRNGAVSYKGDIITVQNSIEVDGTVGYGTGNIDFNGYVDITGSVEDNFSVIADENIQIKGDMGVGAIDLIESRNGDVYIRGGIAGRHKAVVKAKGNVFTKFASDCTIIAEGTVNIGFYAMNCTIVGKEVIFESPKSRLIGGETKADIQVKVSEIGSKAATKTYVHVNGFDRDVLASENEVLIDASKTFSEKIIHYKEQYENLKGKGQSIENTKKIDEAYTKYIQFKEQLVKIQDTIEKYKSYMEARGEGEVKIASKLYGNVFVTIKDKSIQITEPEKLGCSFYYKDETLIKD